MAVVLYTPFLAHGICILGEFQRYHRHGHPVVFFGSLLQWKESLAGEATERLPQNSSAEFNTRAAHPCLSDKCDLIRAAIDVTACLQTWCTTRLIWFGGPFPAVWRVSGTALHWSYGGWRFFVHTALQCNYGHRHPYCIVARIANSSEPIFQKQNVENAFWRLPCDRSATPKWHLNKHSPNWSNSLV